MTFLFDLGNSLVSFFGATGDVISDVLNSYKLTIPQNLCMNHTMMVRYIGEADVNPTTKPLSNDECYCLHIHEHWGYVGFIIIFIPGILLLPPFLSGAIRNKNWKWFFIFIVLVPVYPLTFVILQLLYVISNFGLVDKNISVVANIAIGMEAFLEAFCQLVLQGYTLLYGYQSKTDYFGEYLKWSTIIQIISIVFSFVALSRVAILYDVAMKKINMTFVETMCHILETFPCYAFTTLFRVTSLSLTIAYLREYAIVPICILLLELFIISYLRYMNVEEKSRRFCFVYFATISNVGVLNVNNFGELNADEEDHKDEDDDCKRFIRRSLIVTFLHHATVLSTILFLSQVDPDFFDKGRRGCIILKPDSPHFFWIISVTILVGFQGMVSSLASARRVADVKKDNLRKEIIQTVKTANDKSLKNGTLPQKMSQNMPNPRYMKTKDIKSGTLPPPVIHGNVEKWRARKIETLPRKF